MSTCGQFLVWHIFQIWLRILEIESTSRPLSAKSLLSHDNLSTQPQILVSEWLKSKAEVLYCDLLSGPTAEGSREKKVLSPGKWGSPWSEIFRGSHHCKKSQQGLDDSIFMSGLMNSCRNLVCTAKLILYMYQCWIYEWTRASVQEVDALTISK